MPRFQFVTNYSSVAGQTFRHGALCRDRRRQRSDQPDHHQHCRITVGAWPVYRRDET